MRVPQLARATGLVSIAVAAILSSETAASAQQIAGECGEPPTAAPSLPDGSKANPGDIRVARDAVLSFSASVDTYLSCMDRRATMLFPYMSEDQKRRFNEDLSNIHERRRKLQISMNEQIRAWRKANTG